MIQLGYTHHAVISPVRHQNFLHSCSKKLSLDRGLRWHLSVSLHPGQSGSWGERGTLITASLQHAHSFVGRPGVPCGARIIPPCSPMEQIISTPHCCTQVSSTFFPTSLNCSGTCAERVWVQRRQSLFQGEPWGKGRGQKLQEGLDERRWPTAEQTGCSHPDLLPPPGATEKKDPESRPWPACQAPGELEQRKQGRVLKMKLDSAKRKVAGGSGRGLHALRQEKTIRLGPW